MSSRKGISTIIVAAILIVALIGVSTFVCWVAGVGPFSVSDIDVPYDGELTVTIRECNTLDLTASVSTTGDYYAFFPSGGTAVDSATEDDFRNPEQFVVGTAENINIEVEDEGIWWLYAYAGDFFVDADETLDENSGITDYAEVDANGDELLDYVFEVNVAGLDANKLTVPSRSYTIFVADVDATPTLDAPADQTAIGTGSVTGLEIDWELTVEDLHAIRVAEIYFTTNETIFREDVTITDITITGISASVTQDNPYWCANMKITDSYEPLDTILVMIPDGTPNEIKITIEFSTTFESTEAVDITCNFVPMDADLDQGATVSDTVSIAAA